MHKRTKALSWRSRLCVARCDGKLAETKLCLNQTCRDFPLSWFWKLIFDVCSCYVNFFSFFSFLWYFFTFVCLFCFDLFFFLIPSKLNDGLMHLNYGKDTLQLNTLLLITWFITLVRYMKRFLSSDWLREMQFSGNSVQKRVNSVPRSNKPDWTIPRIVRRTLNFFEP